MVTKLQLEAFRMWRAAEGKLVNDEGETVRPLNAFEKSRAQMQFAEAVAYGGLAAQLQPAVVRSLRTYYRAYEDVTPAFTRQWTLSGIDRDEEYNIVGFNQDDLEAINMGQAFTKGGLPLVGKREGYQEIGLQATGKKGRVHKVGEAGGLDWETIVNTRGGEVNILREFIKAFARHASNQNQIEVARLLVKSSGFANGAGEPINGSVALTANPDLRDPQELADAISQLQAVTVEGEDVSYDKFVVLTSVPNAPKIRQGIGNRRIIRNPGIATANSYSWTEDVDFGADVEVIGWKWLKAIYPSMPASASIIVPVAGEDDLPVLTRNRLDGYEEPSYWIKDANAHQANGGEIDPEADGDFDSDSTVSKVRHVTGASALWPQAIGTSTGAGS